jgi:hypothetical protein
LVFNTELFYAGLGLEAGAGFANQKYPYPTAKNR